MHAYHKYACLWNKLKNNKYHTVGTVPKYERKIVERGKIDTSNTQMHDCSLSWLDSVQFYQIFPNYMTDTWYTSSRRDMYRKDLNTKQESNEHTCKAIRQ